MENTVEILVSRLSVEDFQFTCLCPYESAFTARLRALGCLVYITTIQDDPSWSAIEFVTAIIHRHQIDLIHAHLLNAHTLAAIAGKLSGRPVVATIHSMGLWAQELSVARIAESHLITVCQQAYAQAFSAGVPADRLCLIANGVDIERFQPEGRGSGFREQIGIPNNAPLVGFVGRLAHEKGPDKFVLAAQNVCALHESVHFVIVGEGPEEADLKASIQSSGLSDRIHLAGAWLATEKVYAALDLLAQTSRSEAMPLVLLEAMACGLPVIALAVGGVSSIVEANATGIQVSATEPAGVTSPFPGDWQGVAAAVLYLLTRPKLLASMGAAGRARAVALFDINDTSAQTSSLFRALAFPRSGRRVAAVASIR